MTGVQINMADLFPDLWGLEPGDYVEKHGPVICHVMLPAYIGRKVVIDKSTESHSWFQVGIFEKYFRLDSNTWRAVVYVGAPQRSFIDFYIQGAGVPSSGQLYELRSR